MPTTVHFSELNYNRAIQFGGLTVDASIRWLKLMKRAPSRSILWPICSRRCWTGTAMAVLAVMAGVPREEAVTWVRTHYRKHAVETRWQRTWIMRNTAG